MPFSTSDGVKTEPSREQIERQLALILASRHFRQARSLEKFLSFAVSSSLNGKTDNLKEISLGIEVFHRPADFDPRIDNVVRVQAANLRKKLAEYYLETGSSDEVIIELPKGHYVPTFRLNPNQADSDRVNSEELAPPTVEAISQGSQGSQGDFNRKTGRKAGTATPSSLSHLKYWLNEKIGIPAIVIIGVIAGIITGIGLTVGYGRIGNRPPMSPPTQRRNLPAEYLPIWEKFLTQDTNNLLAYGTPQFFSTEGLYLRDVMINSPEDLDHGLSPRLARIRGSLGSALNSSEIYTGVGEAHGINTVSRFFWDNALNLNIARSRIVRWQELRNTNLIFLSSIRFHTLMDELNYPTDFTINREDYKASIINLKPAPGEQRLYGPEHGEFAIITLWPGKSDSRRILQLSGVTTWATLAAAEYVTDPESLRILWTELEKCRTAHALASHHPYFQILISAEVKDNFPISFRYVTHHDLIITNPETGLNPAIGNSPSSPVSPAPDSNKSNKIESGSVAGKKKNEPLQEVRKLPRG